MSIQNAQLKDGQAVEISIGDILLKSLIAPVYDVAEITPLQKAKQLSDRLGLDVLLKREDLQDIYSFKLRGAYACIKALSCAERQPGVITASAGNHAQGVALAAQKMQIPACIVMPANTSEIKVNAVRDLHAQVILQGDDYDDAYQHALVLAGQQSKRFIHPFDDIEVIAGQGTIGLELSKQWRCPPDAIYIPVGGGGLFAGVAAIIKCLHPNIKLIAVEPDGAACLHAALKQGKPITLDKVDRFADGAAVKTIGQHTFTLIKDLVDEVVTVNDDEICAAIRDIFEDTRTLVEPAGALAVAGIKKHQSRNPGYQRVIAINSGANVTFDRLGHFVERSVYGEQSEALFSVQIEEAPGSFLKFCRALGECSITEFNYRYRAPQLAQVYVGIKIAPPVSDKQTLMQHLVKYGYTITDLTASELARCHLRHLGGGYLPTDILPHQNEYFFRFEFPEQPGALLHFLQILAGRWNISLFHYSNHGAVSNRVLVGFTIFKKDIYEFNRYIQSCGYDWTCENSNPIIPQFLQASNTPSHWSFQRHPGKTYNSANNA